MSSDSLDNPARIRIRRRVAWMDTDGRSSVRYLAVLRDEHDELVAEGEIVTVFIDTHTRRSTAWPDAVRAALAGAGEQTAEQRV